MYIPFSKSVTSALYFCFGLFSVFTNLIPFMTHYYAGIFFSIISVIKNCAVFSISSNATCFVSET